MLREKVVVVTGSARGIGRYIAKTFAAEGGRLALADIDVERLHRTAGEIREMGAEVFYRNTDVRSEDEVRSLMAEVAARWGKIDVLVNNAAVVTHFQWGIPRWPRVRDMSRDFWTRVLQTNLGGTFLCTKHALSYMEQRRAGHIINVYGGGNPQSLGACAYSVSKDAIHTFTRFVAEEEREWNICVVILSPGAAIATEDAPEEARKKMPGPELVANRFVLAAEAPMEFSGRMLTLKDGRLEIVP